MTKFNAKLMRPSEFEENSGNKDWWENNPMTYDWDKSLGDPALTPEYFRAIDQIFGEGHSLLNNPTWPTGKILDKFLPYENFNGREVLEIGCGAGLVSSHIANAGGHLHAVDLTSRAIEMTSKRFELASLKGDIRQMDAEKLLFEDDSMDFVVSWGVIHHSGNMKAVLDQIHRVLRPGGKAYIMVYNRHSLRYQVYGRFWHGVFKLKLLRMSVEEVNGSFTDGHIARHIIPAEFDILANNFSNISYSYSDEKTTILKYLFGLGTPFRYFYTVTRPIEQWLASKWGWYLEAVLTK